MDQTARIWDARTGEAVESLPHQGPARSVAFSLDGQRLATASGATAWVWTLDEDAVVMPLEGHGETIRSVVWTPDGMRLLTASEDRTARIWDARTGATLQTLEGHTDRVFDVAVSSGGSRIATGGRDDTARLWDGSTGQMQEVLEVGEVVVAVAFSPDGGTLATGTSTTTRLGCGTFIWCRG